MSIVRKQTKDEGGMGELQRRNFWQRMWLKDSMFQIQELKIILMNKRLWILFYSTWALEDNTWK